jgi:hypothetical protein
VEKGKQPEVFSPKPKEPGMKVRLRKDGPWIDLGVTHSEILIGLIDSVARLCGNAGVSLHADLVYAIDNLDVHRPKGGA